MPQVIPLEILNNCVVNLRQLVSPGSFKVGTGIFVGKGNKLLLFTAEHVARDMKNDAQLILRGDKDLPISLTINQVCTIDSTGSIPWTFHAIADVAMLELKIDQALINSTFQNRFLPADNIFPNKTTVSRNLELTVIGFPLGLGAVGHFSPFTFRSHASSGLITLARFDNQKPCDFFILENPGMGGYSGGPIFDLSIYKHGAMTTVGTGTFLHGLMHGTIPDQTGGKLAAVTPASYIIELLGQI